MDKKNNSSIDPTYLSLDDVIKQHSINKRNTKILVNNKSSSSAQTSYNSQNPDSKLAENTKILKKSNLKKPDDSHKSKFVTSQNTTRPASLLDTSQTKSGYLRNRYTYHRSNASDDESQGKPYNSLDQGKNTSPTNRAKTASIIRQGSSPYMKPLSEKSTEFGFSHALKLVLNADSILIPDMKNLTVFGISNFEHKKMPYYYTFLLQELITIKTALSRSGMSVNWLNQHRPQVFYAETLININDLEEGALSDDCDATQHSTNNKVETDKPYWLYGNQNNGFPKHVINYLFDKEKLCNDKSALNNKFNHITRSLLQCLCTKNCKNYSNNYTSELNADIINAYLTLLNEHYKDSKVLILTTDFMSQWQLILTPTEDTSDDDHIKLTKHDSKLVPPIVAIKKWNELMTPKVKTLKPRESSKSLFEKLIRFLNRINAELEQYDFICWPYNYSGTHWVLVVCDVNKRIVYWLDSAIDLYLEYLDEAFNDKSNQLAHSLQDFEKNIVRSLGFISTMLVSTFTEYYFKIKTDNKNTNDKPWKLGLIKNLPQQTSGSLDCGVYMCQFIRSLCTTKSPLLVDFDTSNMQAVREGMAIAVGLGRFFENENDLLEYFQNLQTK